MNTQEARFHKKEECPVCYDKDTIYDNLYYKCFTCKDGGYCWDCFYRLNLYKKELDVKCPCCRTKNYNWILKKILDDKFNQDILCDILENGGNIDFTNIFKPVEYILLKNICEGENFDYETILEEENNFRMEQEDKNVN